MSIADAKLCPSVVWLVNFSITISRAARERIFAVSRVVFYDGVLIISPAEHYRKES